MERIQLHHVIKSSPLEAQEVISRLMKLSYEQLATFLMKEAASSLARPAEEAKSNSEIDSRTGPAAPRPAPTTEPSHPPVRRSQGRPRKHPVANDNGKGSPGGNGSESNNLTHLTSPRSCPPASIPSRAKAEPAAMRFWKAAEALNPGAPWRAVSDKLRMNEAVCLDAYRAVALPPNVTAEQASAALAAA